MVVVVAAVHTDFNHQAVLVVWVEGEEEDLTLEMDYQIQVVEELVEMVMGSVIILAVKEVPELSLFISNIYLHTIQ